MRRVACGAAQDVDNFVKNFDFFKFFNALVLKNPV
jgi:hypothetical protein